MALYGRLQRNDAEKKRRRRRRREEDELPDPISRVKQFAAPSVAMADELPLGSDSGTNLRLAEDAVEAFVSSRLRASAS
jgi:hypothetical protein